MATWEDGPEYAPALRPDHFAEPSAPPLPAAPPAPPPGPPAPAERPAFDHPYAPVAPLETLVPPIENQRDPGVPFEVATAAVTEATSAWGAAHWSPPSGPPAPVAAPDPYAPLGVGSSGPFPVAAPIAAPPPNAPFPPPQTAASGPFPAPGTTEWFQPAPPYPPGAPPVRGGPGVIAQTLTIGVIVTLVVGGVVWPLAPIAFGIAFGLASRIQVGRRAALAVFGVAAALLVLIGLVAAVASDGFFTDWWDVVARWSQVLCWLTLIGSWIAVWRALKGGPPAVGPRLWG